MGAGAAPSCGDAETGLEGEQDVPWASEIRLGSRTSRRNFVCASEDSAGVIPNSEVDVVDSVGYVGKNPRCLVLTFEKVWLSCSIAALGAYRLGLLL